MESKPETPSSQANILIATWQGGGAALAAVGLGRLLAERGHRVRILGPAVFANRVAAAGCAHRSIPAEAEFDMTLGRAAESQEPYVMQTFFGDALPAALRAEFDAEPADLVVVDFLQRSVACAAEQLGVPHVLLVHLVHNFYGSVSGEGTQTWGWRWQYDTVNAIRQRSGLPALQVGPQCLADSLMRRAARAFVVMPAEFDAWPGEIPSNVVHVGAIAEEPAASSWDTPWLADDDRPLIVVTMGSTYMHQEDVVGRIATALGEVDARVLVLTGLELSPNELHLPTNVEVRAYVPHAAVLPGAALVVTHAGIGTLMAAFAAGVPVVCLPLGRDQYENAQRTEELGCGLVASPDASPVEIADAVRDALSSAALREGARRMRAAMATYRDGELAVRHIEQLVAHRRGAFS